jgi:GH43 family beta-xylosidase
MSNPWTVSSPLSDRQILSSPTNAWEKTPHGRTINDRLSTNEGPQQLTNPATNATFVIYSAGRSDNRNYCLGLLAFTGTDPMNPEDWEKDESGCVFYQNAEEDVYGVGHASFVESPDGEESWIVYHGMREPGLGWAARTIRAQRFEWASEEEGGRPLFPRPGIGPYEVPSGQNGSGK